ncbi:putative ABC transporter ATP-binding protein [Andreesenia angusta]|uniref:Putative ABC transporter ATP-binding protein n=1 Tax=Andreesenia angusta TaxID=39480 RepID=A0A1S1V7C9_9FIRM|nr:ABC transporter ATP-binding protein [Andreesenia angusta]OHW62300.1 putative ABC transporter ATP-binding protein [Andreesenia angusta]
MKTIIKYLKPFAMSIILIVGLLFVQAMTELSLPDYMSSIVNVGIQQGGIESSVPEAIRASELEKMFLFMEEDDAEYVKSVYKLDSSGAEGVYVLSDKDMKEDSRLSGIFTDSIVVLEGVRQRGGEESLAMISQMPKDQLESLKSEIDKGLANVTDSIKKQGSLAYVKSEYEAVGLDVSEIQSDYILSIGAKMIGIALLGMAASVVVGLIGARVAAGLGRNLRSSIFQKVMAFSNSEFDKFSTASLITRSTNDIQQIQMLMVFFLRIVFYAPIMGVGGIIKVLNTETSMAWIIALAVGAVIVLMAGLFGLSMPKFKKVQTLVDKVNMITRESLVGMLVIRAFNNQKYEEEKFEKANVDLTSNSLFTGRVMMTMMPLMMLVMNLTTILIVWIGAKQVDIGSIQIGDMMAFIQYAMQIIMSFLMISMVSIMLPRATVSANRVGEVIETDYSIVETKSPKSFVPEKSGEVEFRNVSFRYPGAEEDVLKNIDFVAKRGETTAFIGSTGSGKSTLINLIPRFYDTTEGEVLVNGVNVKELSQKDLRSSIGYVPQKGVLFSGDIESNIKYGAEHIDESQVLKAAEISQSMEFIDGKEDGFKTRIAQGGSNVSGGQKQRLSIARALAKEPDIFIFDDSFSALDFKTDLSLRNALKKELSDSTLLIVAQRISTIVDADKIIVLDQGQMVGVGVHRELLENCEVYRQIAESQLSKEELSDGK